MIGGNSEVREEEWALAQFDGKVALVTGGANGIGRASALAFAREGAKVVVGDLAESDGQSVADQIMDEGGKARFIRTDVTRMADLENLAKAAVETFGGLDFAHNNAGSQFGGPGFMDTDPEQWDQTQDLCLKAVWMGMKVQIPLLQRRGGGAIVNTTSMAGWRTHAAASACYSAAKRGVMSLTEFAAVEFAQDGIRVNAIAPGLVRTKIVDELFTPERQNELASGTQPIGRIIEPSEIADSVIFLCSKRSAMITGATIPVCGGNNAN